MFFGCDFNRGGDTPDSFAASSPSTSSKNTWYREQLLHQGIRPEQKRPQSELT